MSKKYQIGDVVRVRVERIVPRGFGISFVEGLTVMTTLAVPGDVLDVRLVDLKKRLAFAEIVDVVEPGPERVEPVCKYFGTCGGCDFQQLSYEAQLRAKVGIIQDCLRRIGKIDPVPTIATHASPRAYGYRSRARWHFDLGQQKVGYYRRDSRNLIDIDSCPILTPELESGFQEIRRELFSERMALADEGEIDGSVSGDGQVSIASSELAARTDDLKFSVAGETWRYSARAFFQANHFLIEPLIQAAIGEASGALAYDLYSGVGLFTLPLARRFESVRAVEGWADSVEFARQNVAEALLSNASIEQSSVSRFLRNATHEEIDLIVLDPPRSGTEPGVIEAIAELNPRLISYISCEPSMLARDLRVLLDRGYKIDSLHAVDLFPQTHHVETVARLKRGVADADLIQ